MSVHWFGEAADITHVDTVSQSLGPQTITMFKARQHRGKIRKIFGLVDEQKLTIRSLKQKNKQNTSQEEQDGVGCGTADSSSLSHHQGN